jgi:hypothetical protein
MLNYTILIYSEHSRMSRKIKVNSQQKRWIIAMYYPGIRMEILNVLPKTPCMDS